jgi:hypothetical protein
MHAWNYGSFALIYIYILKQIYIYIYIYIYLVGWYPACSFQNCNLFLRVGSYTYFIILQGK